MQIGVIYGNPEVTSGGNALKFYASVRLEVRRKATHESAKGESVGIRVKAKVSILFSMTDPCSACSCISGILSGGPLLNTDEDSWCE